MNRNCNIPGIWLVIVICVFGCRPAVKVQPVVELQSEMRIVRDAGIVGHGVLDFNFFIGSQGTKKVASVFISCGCTTVDVQQDDEINFEHPIHVRIQMPAGNFGKGQQSFTLDFTDGKSLTGVVKYDYQPEPFFSPDKILFFEDVTERTVRFCFPGEGNVTINDISVPKGMIWAVTAKPQQFLSEITFKVERNLFDSAVEGTIQITTSSLKKPDFQLPYLVLMP